MGRAVFGYCVKNSEWHRYAALLFGSKALGLALLMLAITVFDVFLRMSTFLMWNSRLRTR